MKKIIFMLMILSTVSYASWWGRLSRGERAGIIGGSALILNNVYQDSELHHQRSLDRLDRDIRRDYERRAVAENAHYKYRNTQAPARLQSPDYYSGQQYNSSVGQKGRVIYNDGHKQIIRLENGMNVVVE